MGSLLEGKICLITGCAQGIGRAIAELFCQEGATVYANDLEQNRTRLEEMASGSLKEVCDSEKLISDTGEPDDGIKNKIQDADRRHGMAAINSEKASRNSEKAMQHSMKAMQDSEKAMKRSIRIVQDGVDASVNFRAARGSSSSERNDENGAEKVNTKTWSGKIIPLVFDITDTTMARQAIQSIKQEAGRLDVLVNNAGIAFNEAIGLIDYDHVARMFQVNVFAALELMQLSARVMRKQRSGAIINISSMVGMNGDKGQTAYSASKGAVIAMTKSAAKELAPYNIRVNSVAPGLTDTPLFHATDTQKLEERISSIGFGRIAQPSDIAQACAFLASDRAGYITGQVLGVDGGV